MGRCSSAGWDVDSVKLHEQRALARVIAGGVARYLTNAPLRRSIHAATVRQLWQLPKHGVMRTYARHYATMQTLFAPSEGRVDILATRHVAYLAHVVQATIAGHGVQSQIYYDDEIMHDYGQRFVVLCPHVFAAMPQRYIAFQLEQSVSSRWFTAECIQRLQRAEAVWEYSQLNMQFLVDHGVQRDKLVYMPISTAPDYPGLLATMYPHFVMPTTKTIDVLFYGDPHSPRRQLFLKRLQTRFAVRVVDKVFGAELMQLVASAKLVANIHYYEGALLETTRLSEAMSLGIPVVSETAADQADHASLAPAVRFTPVGDVDGMVTAIAELLDHPEAYAAQHAAVIALQRSDSRFADAISAALHLAP